MTNPSRYSINGHYYLISEETVLPWETAQSLASSSTYRGLSGYLVTITDAGEHEFINALVSELTPTGQDSVYGYTSVWLGATDKEVDGTFRWVGGPEAGDVFLINGVVQPGMYNGIYLQNKTADGRYHKYLISDGLAEDDWDYVILNQSPSPFNLEGYRPNFPDLSNWIPWRNATDFALEGLNAGNKYIIEYGGLPATYNINVSNSTVNEGSSVTFEILTTNVEWGSTLTYTISGVSAGDLSSGSTSGSLSVGENGVNGKATLTLSLASDQLTEGNETLTVTVQGRSASTTINDTSTASATPTYSLAASSGSVNEGSTATFTLTTTNVAGGTGVSYLISGVSEADVVGGALSGTATINSSGQATITVPIAADLLTEGTETLRVIVSDQTATMSVADTSVAAASSTNNTTNTNTGNTTNITNVTNVTNVTNTTNTTSVTGNNNTVNVGNTTTDSGNTTNTNSGNTTNVNSGNTTSVDIGTLNNIRNFDASVTNDSSVTQNVFGNITNYEGSVSNNVLVGSNGVDQLLGLAGNDRFYSSKGDDTYDGGEGLDGITFNGNRSNFTLSKSGSNWVIQDLREGDANEGRDTLIGVERLGFGDEAIALDFDQGDSSYNTVMMIGAAFGKALVPTYFGVGVTLFDQGATTAEIAQTIADLKLIETTIGTEDTTAWINHVYKNLVGVEPDPLSLGLVSNLLETGAYTRASLLTFAAELPLLETQVDITGLQSTGLTYTPFG